MARIQGSTREGADGTPMNTQAQLVVPRPPMSRAPGARVLVDLSHAADGYVGVAQDLRLIFGMLCEPAGRGRGGPADAGRRATICRMSAPAARIIRR